MGGLSVIQAKRYTKLVPADAARALWGVMEDKKAGTGVLVTTSYLGKATHDFAKHWQVRAPRLSRPARTSVGARLMFGGNLIGSVGVLWGHGFVG
ncbi:restriction endonuclease [Saccharopolyspora sp. NPDC002376]